MAATHSLIALKILSEENFSSIHCKNVFNMRASYAGCVLHYMKSKNFLILQILSYFWFERCVTFRNLGNKYI